MHAASAGLLLCVAIGGRAAGLVELRVGDDVLNDGAVDGELVCRCLGAFGGGLRENRL